jgi:hypothetical protein
MSRKNVLPSFKFIDATSAGSSFTSQVTDITYLDNVAIHLLVPSTGTPIGTFSVLGSVKPDAADADCVAITLGSTPAATGAGDQILINLPALAAPFIRVKYTKSSGTGTVTGWICGKAI